MFRLGHNVDGQWVEHVHPPVYRLHESANRLTATAPFSDPAVFVALGLSSPPPYLLLYVLHTPRGEGEPGRYQSPDMSVEATKAFLNDYTPFLHQDGRFDLWIHSPETRTTIVWDRHNLIHAYGSAERFAEILQKLGFSPGKPSIPSPHEHYYHSDLDDMARDLLDAIEWYRKPLRPEDEQ